MKNKALFIDRDGIFNYLVEWGGGLCAPRCWPEVTFYPGLEKLPQFKQQGYRLILVTNQPDIERNTTEKRFVDELNALYRERYQLDAVYMCPFSSDEHPMKKPNPGMLLQAQKDFDLDLSRSFFLGDTEKDVQAAARAKVPSILWSRPYNQDVKADHRINSLEELNTILLFP